MNIIIFGDSIAYGKYDSQGGWAQRLRRHLDEKYLSDRSKGYNQVYNMGIPGEVAIRLHTRVEKELSDRKFNEIAVIFAIGINDSCSDNWMSGKQSDESEFKESIEKAVSIVRKANCKLYGIGLTPTDGTNRQDFNEEDVKKYDRMLTEIYAKLDVPKLELHDTLVEEDFKDQLVDGVHPNDEGHEVLFKKILSFLQENKVIE